MAKYGFGYLGSKSQIADEIIAALPSGERFVDLFGGGFAMSHCALLSYKYKKVLYNDINSLTVQLLKDALAGKYNYAVFKPEWISREEFDKRKYTDGYVKWCWSFANDGNGYIYGNDVVDLKHAGHDFCVYGTPIPGLDFQVETTDIKQRRLALCNYVKKSTGFRSPLTEIESLERIERLELQNLESLERLQNLEITNMDYREYKYQAGDVVYCDIPYQNGSNAGQDYDGGFDAGAFYAWAVSRPYPVYFSSYKLGGILWERDKLQIRSGSSNSKVRREVVYCVNDDFEEPKKYFQGNLFERLM